MLDRWCQRGAAQGGPGGGAQGGPGGAAAQGVPGAEAFNEVREGAAA